MPRRTWDILRMRLRSLASRNRVEEDLDRELRFHLEQQLQENLAAGMPPERIIFSGVGKTRGEMERALAAGIHQINIESIPELRRLSEIAATQGWLAPVAIRGELAWIGLREASGISTRRVGGLDPALAMTEITGGDVTADVIVAGERAAAAWAAVATAGRLALGYQILGAVGQMIDLAVDHARSRVQFGRPVGSFQAVRNRLSDAHVAREGAAAALASAWDTDDAVLAGLLAKSLAGRAARIAATQCQQVLAGIGFTAEHPFHGFLARALVLDSVLGSAAELPKAIGAHLISAGSVPRLVDL